MVVQQSISCGLVECCYTGLQGFPACLFPLVLGLVRSFQFLARETLVEQCVLWTVSSWSLWKFGQGGGYSHTALHLGWGESLVMHVNEWQTFSSVPIRQTLVQPLSRAKDTEMITSLEELVHLQGVHRQLVLEITLWQFSEERAGQEKENPSGSWF